MKVKPNLCALFLIATSCAWVGCDLGTYRKRLNEKKPTPVAEPTDEASSDQEAGDHESDDESGEIRN